MKWDDRIALHFHMELVFNWLDLYKTEESGGNAWCGSPPLANQLDVSSIRQCNHFTVPVPGHLIPVICVARFIILDSNLKMHVRSNCKANSLFHQITHRGYSFRGLKSNRRRKVRNVIYPNRGFMSILRQGRVSGWVLPP